MMSVSPGSSSFTVGLGFVVIALLLGGCSGGDTYSLDSGDLSQRFMPTEQKVDYHPDSLGALSIKKEEGKYSFELEDDYESLHRKWSSSYQNLGTSRSRRGRSYATFWSLELSLASLQPEVGITSLSEEQAEKSFRDRREEYATTIQIDVYWFEAEGNSLLAGPGSRVELRVNGERVRPQKEDHGPLREAFLPAATRTALYRRNTFHFARIVDSTDILNDAQGMELIINRSGASSRVRFAWSWEAEEQAHVQRRRWTLVADASGRDPRGWAGKDRNTH